MRVKIREKNYDKCKERDGWNQMTRQRKCAHWEFSGRIKRNLFVTSALSVSYDVSFATSSDRSLWSSTLCKKFCEWKKLKSSNISGKMF